VCVREREREREKEREILVNILKICCQRVTSHGARQPDVKPLIKTINE
jgi:hypothetical protein